MPAGHVVFECNQRMGRISEIVKQDLNSSIWKRFADQAHNPLVILQELVRVVGDLFAVVFLEELRVDLLLCRFELRADVVLLTDKDELPRGSMIFVFEEVMHSQPKIFQAKLAKILSSNNKRIEVVLFEISPKLASPFFVFAPQEAESQKEQRYNDRRNDVDRELTLQSVDHIANILFIT